LIRDRNNITWRNLNVVPNTPDPAVDPSWVILPFVVTGAPDRGRRMRLEIVARLPRASVASLELPLHVQQALRLPLSSSRHVHRRRRVARVSLNPHGTSPLGEMLFPAGFRAGLRLMIQIPIEFRTHPHEVCVRQYLGEEEVGRVTWRLVPGRAAKEAPGDVKRTRTRVATPP
jgi:hypothetical protein